MTLCETRDYFEVAVFLASDDASAIHGLNCNKNIFLALLMNKSVDLVFATLARFCY